MKAPATLWASWVWKDRRADAVEIAPVLAGSFGSGQCLLPLLPPADVVRLKVLEVVHQAGQGPSAGFRLVRAEADYQGEHTAAGDYTTPVNATLPSWARSYSRVICLRRARSS